MSQPPGTISESLGTLAAGFAAVNTAEPSADTCAKGLPEREAITHADLEPQEGVCTRSKRKLADASDATAFNLQSVSSVSSTTTSSDLSPWLSANPAQDAEPAIAEDPRTRSFRRSRTAEEKAARVRARNRRAQQAFRSRQKAAALAKAASLDRMKKELDSLRRVNHSLRSLVKELTHKVEELSTPVSIEDGSLLDMNEGNDHFSFSVPAMQLVPVHVPGMITM